MTKERKAISIHEKLDVIKRLERSKRILPRTCLRDNVKIYSAKLGMRVSLLRIFLLTIDYGTYGKDNENGGGDENQWHVIYFLTMKWL